MQRNQCPHGDVHKMLLRRCHDAICDALDDNIIRCCRLSAAVYCYLLLLLLLLLLPRCGQIGVVAVASGSGRRRVSATATAMVQIMGWW